MPEGAMRRLYWASFLAVATHLGAGLAMALVLRHGLETKPDVAGRMAFIITHRLAWTLAWLTWTLAALSILYFFRSFTAAHREETPSQGLLGAALLAGVVAVAADISAQLIEVVALPGYAAWGALDSGEAAGTAGFLACHRRAVLLTGFLANGLYTLASGLLAWACRSRYPGWVNAAAAGVVAAGCGLSAAALAGSAPGMLWSNAALVPAILAWLVGVGMTARCRDT